VGYPDGSVGVPVPFDVDSFTGMRTTASAYGEDTDAVLTRLGYDETSLVDLRATGTIW
jgi:crotonobetainyl-CoA:carnitine CoA-transferase CaiB-like acyl-CoA transferase